MQTTLYIQNLKYEGCMTIIMNSLSALNHIKNITIKLQYATVTFEHENNDHIEEVKHILSKIGFPPFDEKNT